MERWWKLVLQQTARGQQCWPISLIGWNRWKGGETLLFYTKSFFYRFLRQYPVWVLLPRIMLLQVLLLYLFAVSRFWWCHLFLSVWRKSKVTLRKSVFSKLHSHRMFWPHPSLFVQGSAASCSYMYRTVYTTFHIYSDIQYILNSTNILFWHMQYFKLYCSIPYLQSVLFLLKL